MPAPAVPRRTAPPRRKPPKSPVPAPPEEAALVEAAEAESAGLETHPEVEQDVLGDAEPLTKEEEKEKVAVVLPVVGTVAAVVAEEEEHVEALEETVVEEPEQQEHEYEHEEEDEDTRRRRIAERIAKMGAINPFAPPPPRSMSGSDAGLASPPASAAVLVRRSSVDSVGSVKSGRVAKRASVGSISSISGGAALATRGSIDSAKEVEPGAAMGGPVAGGIPEQDEREESVPENVPEGGNDAMAMSMILERSPPLPPLPPSDIEEEAHGLGPSPALDRSTRPPVPVPQATQTQTQTQTQVGDHRKWASGYITRPPQSDEEREHDRATIEQGVKQTRDASPPPLPVSPRISSTGLCRRFTADEDEGRGGDEEPRPLPIPHRPSIVSPKPVWTKAPDVVEEEDEYEKDEEQDEVKHVPPPPRRQVPLPPPSPSPAHPINADSITPQDSIVVEGTKQEQELELEPEPTSAHSDAPLVIPPPERRCSRDDVTHDKPLPHRMSFRQPHPVQARSPESEVMDDEEGDPIDPSIHVPKRVSVRSGGGSVPSTPTSPIPPVPAVSVHKVDPQDEEKQQSREVVDSASMGDTEGARRHTIAERMAKLGGIKFGAAPPIPGTRLPLAASTERADEADERRETDEKAVEGEGRGEDEKKGVDEDEEEERARKERIAAKLAGMGGMRIGMMPPMMGIPPRSAQRPQPPLPTREEAATPVPTPTSPTVATRGPPTRPPPPPLPQDAEWERGSASNSEDGVKVEMEESDMEEVDHEDARMEDEEGYEEGEMVAPPPPPRGHPPLSPTQRTRPPVPSTARTRKASDGTIAAPARRGSGGSGTTTTTTTTSTTITQRPRGQSDYVMVDEPQNAEEGEEEEVPPPPPARPVQRRATRESPVHPHPPPLQLMSDSISSQWELTSAPSGSVGLGTMTTDLSSSWTEAGDLTGSRITLVPPAHAAPPAEPSTPSTAERRLSSDELMAIWGRVGVQVCEAATGLLERSKKAVVGDGTYAGYVHAVLDGVPNAARHGYHEWGYLVYAQTGTAVHKRVSDIMPGDVVELVDARFKGHKGLQTYSQHVGAAGEALVGVVSEMESKKSKVRVMQANRQVGQPMVESASYRLEDLKSGMVNVYRVLEA
ncbi:hypothetical protein APHAL10511_004596 [Amanita phalloides]|nr:hypothetical protein APHAL10511_004596 [Amanita phalloides]